MKNLTVDFQKALDSFISNVSTMILWPQINKQWMNDHGHEYITLHAEVGNKFVKIISIKMKNSSSSVWAFIAIEDGYSKALGNYKRGDIFKPASWQMPAKHARGNIFQNENNPTCNVTQWTGPSYLK